MLVVVDSNPNFRANSTAIKSIERKKYFFIHMARFTPTIDIHIHEALVGSGSYGNDTYMAQILIKKTCIPLSYLQVGDFLPENK